MARIELVEGTTAAQSVVGEAERARGSRFAARRPLTGRTRESAEDLAGESPTAAAALESDEALDAAAAEAATGIVGEGGEVETPKDVTEAEQVDVPTEGDTDLPDAGTDAVAEAEAPEHADEAPEQQAEAAGAQSQAEGDADGADSADSADSADGADEGDKA